MKDLQQHEIRVGDLIRITNKQDPETKHEGRVKAVTASETHGYYVEVAQLVFAPGWVWFEIIDRPKPPVPAALVEEATAIYRRGMGFRTAAPTDQFLREKYDAAMTAVIEHVRDHYMEESK